MPYPLNLVSLPITQNYGYPVTSKMRAAVIKQAQKATLVFQLYDPYSLTPVDLSAYTSITAKTRFLESSGTCSIAADAAATVIDVASTGMTSCVVPNEITGNSGVYSCEVGIFNSTPALLFSNTCYVLVERGLFTISATLNPYSSGLVGPPNLDEIRLNLRDQPEINRLIDEFEFDVADICEAAVRSVMYFNMTQPQVNMYFATTNFPWRYQWMDGIAAHLYEMASSYYRRNVLQHQTAGLSVNDLNREQAYNQAWQTRNERWSTWVKTKKVEINMSEGFGEFASSYSNYDGYRGGCW